MADRKPIPLSAIKAPKASLDDRLAEFRKRRESSGLDWRAVSGTSLKTAILAIHSEDMAVMFSPATGGLGICVSLYKDRQKKQEYFMVAQEFNDYLELLIDTFSNSAEDVRQSMVGGEG